MSLAEDLRVLFITDRWDAPYRYRCMHACEQLRAGGAVANVAHVSDENLIEDLARYGVIVLFRLPWQERVEAIVDGARRAGLPLVFDVDDLVFDPAAEELFPFRQDYSATEWRATYGRQLVALRRTFTVCDLFIGSTPALAEHAAKFGKAAKVHPNLVPSYYLRCSDWARRTQSVLRIRPTIGYFSGSDTHDQDFASIAGALETVLRRQPDAQLLLCGHLDAGARLRQFQHRIARLPYMHWTDFAWALGVCHVNLAPQAERNTFTNSKSALKFFEAGAFGVPTVATPVTEMERAIEHGQSGWLATTENEWIEAIERSLDDSVSDQTGQAAHRAVLANHSAAAHRGELAALLGDVAVRGHGKPPRRLPIAPPGEGGSARWTGLDAARATVAMARIARAVREPPRPVVDHEGLERWMNAVTNDRTSRRDALRSGGVVVATGPGAWRGNDQLSPDGQLPGEQSSTGADPSWTSPELAVDPSQARYAVFRLRVSARSRRANAQIFWRGAEHESFSEDRSIVFPVSTDGCDATYVVDLWRPPHARAWRDIRRVTHLRFDPCDRAGSVRLGGIAMVSEKVAEGPDSTSVPTPAPPMSLSQTLPGARAALGNAARRLGAGERLVAELSLPSPDAREVLADWAGDWPVFVRNVSAIESRTRFELEGARKAAVVPVVIVVPVYNAREKTLQCLRSVVRHARGKWRLVVVDDASTDQDLKKELREIASEHERITLLENDRNLGFVRTSNRGMREARGSDVLLLNSDAEVFSGFLQGLRQAAYSTDKVGFVSPLSNNATICSVPEFCRYNDVPAGMTRAEMATFVGRVSLRLRPELVTPHGFCLYMREDCLREVGDFDEDLYGRGFGEENDLGERAKSAGWKIRLADDVYVWHHGKASFGKDEGEALSKKHATVLEREQPGYHAAVARFIEDNPLAPVHNNLLWHLRRGTHRHAPAPLLMLHSDPFARERGGIEHAVRDLLGAMTVPRAVLAYPAPGGIEVAEVVNGEVSRPVRYHFPLSRPVERFAHTHDDACQALEQILRLFRIGWVHVHHLMWWPLRVADVLASAKMPYVVTVHDFYPVCPSFNLLDHRTTAQCCPASCKDKPQTASCMKTLFGELALPLPEDPSAFVEEHREHFASLLACAERVIFPSESTRRIVQEVFDLAEERAIVVPHGYDLPPRAPREPRGTRPLRVALVGEVSYASKGADAYLATMDRCRKKNVEWHIFGRTDRFGFDDQLDALSKDMKIVRHGGFERHEIVGHLAKADVDIGLLLPPWHETFSYTLSELLAADVPVVAKRVGALENRLQGRDYGRLVGGPSEAAREILRLEADSDALSAFQAAAEKFEHESTEPWATRHAELYESCAPLAPSGASAPLSREECKKMNELTVAVSAMPTEAAGVTRPAASLTRSFWYPHALRLGAYLPESVRQVARRGLAADGMRDVRRFRLPSGRARVGGDLVLEKRYLRSARFRAVGGDPHFLLDVDPVDAESVQAIRFNIWCSHAGFAFAQVYWRGESDTTFNEDRSVTVRLDGHQAKWQEYVVRLDNHERAPAWYESGSIVALRFDPINVPGPVCVGELALCKASAAS